MFIVIAIEAIHFQLAGLLIFSHAEYRTDKVCDATKSTEMYRLAWYM